MAAVASTLAVLWGKQFSFCRESGTLVFPNSVDVDSIFSSEIKRPLNNDLYNNIEKEICVCSNVVCVFSVPGVMIPVDIVNFFSASISDIICIRVFHRLTDGDDYLLLIQFHSKDSAATFIKNYNGQLLSSLDLTTCVLSTVESLSLERSSDEVVHAESSLHQLYSFVDDASISLADLPRGLRKVGALAAASSPTIFRPRSASPFVEASAAAATDGDICVLCLDSMASTGLFVSFCGHAFHLHCVQQLEAPQCPICRFQHDDVAASSACLRCSGPVSGFTASLDYSLSDLSADAAGDVWLCLVCGFVGCGRTRHDHIGLHYNESLHAYAVNTETRQVWDFAGSGYVHRLVLGNNEADCSLKVAEVADPRSSSAARPLVAPVSEAVEEMQIHRKMEKLAGEYTRELTGRLEEQRTQYEARLRLVNRFVKEEIDALRQGKHVVDGNSWAAAMLHHAEQEKCKLENQLAAAKNRLEFTRREVGTLHELNKSLHLNKTEWQQLAATATCRLDEIRASTRTWLQSLERRVADLMNELEASDAASSSCANVQATTLPLK